MDFGLNGKVAMVAASSKGIGFAIAQSLAEEGCKVSMCARGEEALEYAEGQIEQETRSYVVDLSKEDELTWWFEQTNADLGPVDILVTNTGGPPAGRFTEMSDEQWKQGIDGTLMNVVRLVRLASPGMAERNWGRIVHLTSLVAKEPSPLLPISSTIRAGLTALTRLQSTELAPNGVTVNAVLPGHTLTDRQLHLAEIRAAEEAIDVQEALRRQAETVPMKRLGKPEEIAAAVTFLCSIQASYISGVNLLVDGGIVRGPG